MLRAREIPIRIIAVPREREGFASIQMLRALFDDVMVPITVIALGVVDLRFVLHGDAAHSIHKTSQVQEADLGVVRDIHAQQIFRSRDSARSSIECIGRVEFLRAVPVDVDLRVARDGDHGNHVFVGIDACHDVRVRTPRTLFPFSLVSADEHHVERLVQ